MLHINIYKTSWCLAAFFDVKYLVQQSILSVFISYQTISGNIYNSNYLLVNPFTPYEDHNDITAHKR